MLTIGLSSYAYASEVTGTLSSTSTGNENSTSVSGSISGTVSSPSSGTGGGSFSNGSSNGSVLGASTGPIISPIISTNNTFSPNNTAFVPSSRGLAISSGTDDGAVAIDGNVLGAEANPDITSPQIAAATGGFTGFSGMTWFWIIILLLLLLAFIIYLYKREDKNKVKIQ